MKDQLTVRKKKDVCRLTHPNYDRLRQNTMVLSRLAGISLAQCYPIS